MVYVKRAARLAALLWLSATALALAHQGAREVSSGCNTHGCAARVCKAPCQARRAARVIAAGDRAWLAKVRACESGGNYAINTGNGFFGAYQFTLQSWHAVGGRGLPHQAPPWEQDMRALRLRRLQGRGAWPVCG